MPFTFIGTSLKPASRLIGARKPLKVSHTVFDDIADVQEPLRLLQSHCEPQRQAVPHPHDLHPQFPRSHDVPDAIGVQVRSVSLDIAVSV
jgi:hypothetical protein